jgi:hypothetical protein
MYICEVVEQARSTCIIKRGDLLFIVHFPAQLQVSTPSLVGGGD